MGLTRRRLLVAAVAIPAAVTLRAAIARVANLTPALRPTAAGTTADRCAACGSGGHSMLDPRCPAAPQVLG